MKNKIAVAVAVLVFDVPLIAASFDSPSSGGALLPSAAAVDVPAPSAPRMASSVSAPETAYENLLVGPLWNDSGAVSGSADLRSSFLPARSQGNRNMCNVFATTALSEFLVNTKENSSQSFSEEFLFYDTKYNYTDRPELQSYKSDSGLAGYVAVMGLAGGVVHQSEWPFNPDWKNPSPQAPVTDPDVGLPPDGIMGKVLGYKFSPIAIRRSEIKDFILREHKPVVINLMVYAADWSGKGGRFNLPSQQDKDTCASGGNNCGGHVVLLVGYDSKTGDFLFRNSWGPGWGENGYGRVSDRYVQDDCESCSYLPRLSGFDEGSRIMVVNSSYGWSAELK
jgi:hypothetical protein